MGDEVAVGSTRHNHHRLGYISGMAVLGLFAFALYITVLHRNPGLPLISALVLGLIFPLITFGMKRNHLQQPPQMH
jgi:hypothetical protein